MNAILFILIIVINLYIIKRNGQIFKEVMEANCEFVLSVEGSLDDQHTSTENIYIEMEAIPIEEKETPSIDIIAEASSLDTTEDIELTKPKVEDNLSKICKSSTEQKVKATVKADLIMECLSIEFKDVKNSRADLEKIISDCEIQQNYLQSQLDLERSNRPELNKQMETVTTMIHILKKKITDYDREVKESKSRMLEYKKEADKALMEFKLQNDRFEKASAKNKIRIEECKKQLKNRQHTLLENRRLFANEKAALEQNINEMREQIAIVQRKNEELSKTKEDRLRQLDKHQQSLNKAKQAMKRQKLEQQQKMNVKLLEAEGAKQRLAIQLDSLNELKGKVESVKKEEADLLEVNKDLALSLQAKEIKYNESVKNLDRQRKLRSEELRVLANNNKVMEEKVGQSKLKINATFNSSKDIKDKLETLKVQVQNASSTISSLTDSKDTLKEEIAELNHLHQTHISQNKSFKEIASSLNNEVSQLNEDIFTKEKYFVELQAQSTAEYAGLEAELNELKEIDLVLSQSVIEFKNIKIIDLERIELLRVSNEAKLNELTDTLQQLKNDEESQIAKKKDLSEKVLLKANKRNSLHSYYKKLQEEVNRLEEEVKHTKKHQDRIKEASTFQKPTTSILKNAGIKSTQKKVTFNKLVNWDSLSESSTDAFFETLKMKTEDETTIVNRNPMDDLLAGPSRNSPPERDGSNSTATGL